MKHGPIALLDPRTPVVGIVTEGRVREKMLSNLMESKAREAPIIVVANHGDDEAASSPTTSCGSRRSTSCSRRSST